jgi:hypothetical protein
MIRKFVCAAAVLALVLGVALADEFGASISKISDGKITFAKTKFNKDTKKFEKGDEMTLPVAADVKVTKGKFNKETKKFEAGDPLDGGLKNEMFSKIGEKGVGATIVTDADNKKITEIRVFSFGKKKDSK